jgi:hypothetical protein
MNKPATYGLLEVLQAAVADLDFNPGKGTEGSGSLDQEDAALIDHQGAIQTQADAAFRLIHDPGWIRLIEGIGGVEHQRSQGRSPPSIAASFLLASVPAVREYLTIHGWASVVDWR